MSRYRVLVGGVWKSHKEGDIVDTPQVMDFYLKEGIVEELVLPLHPDRDSGQPIVQLRVSDVRHKLGTS